MSSDRFEIRTVCDDPLCSRVTSFTMNQPPGKRLVDCIIGYRSEMGTWPSIEQISNAIERFQKGDP